MGAFFASRERVEALEAAAVRWAGTPFRHGSCVCQVGANCVLAIWAVLGEAGFRVPRPELVPTAWARYQKRSVMEEWLDARGNMFERVEIRSPKSEVRSPSGDLRAGDLVGFRVGLCVHHLGLILSGGRFFQCNESLGAMVLSQAERMFRERVARAWRPIAERQ